MVIGNGSDVFSSPSVCVRIFVYNLALVVVVLVVDEDSNNNNNGGGKLILKSKINVSNGG